MLSVGAGEQLRRSVVMSSVTVLLVILGSAIPAGVAAASNVCAAGQHNSTAWAFSVNQRPSSSCSSSAGATNDMGNSPTPCLDDPASVRIAVTWGQAECLVARSPNCKIPMRDFLSLDYDFHISDCNGIWAAPLWMTPDKWQWGPGSGEIDSEEFCSRDAIHMNFAGGGAQKQLDPVKFNIAHSDGHITVRKDEAGIVTITACTIDEAASGGGQCAAPLYSDCASCSAANNTYACFCNPSAGNIYGSGGCAQSGGGDCMWTLVSDIWNGVKGDAGYDGCMTAVPSIGLAKGKPNLRSSCTLSVEGITVRGGGPGGSIRWGPGSPPSCSVLTP